MGPFLIVSGGELRAIKRRRMSDNDPDTGVRQNWLRVAFAVATTLIVVVAAYLFIRFITRVH
jgi:hypothetical protein